MRCKMRPSKNLRKTKLFISMAMTDDCSTRLPNRCSERKSKKITAETTNNEVFSFSFRFKFNIKFIKVISYIGSRGFGVLGF